MAEESMKDFEQEINESFKTAKKVENEDGGKWEHLQSLVESKEQFNVKIIEVVKGGCIAYLEDTRAFIPASQLSSSYVEKLEDFQNKHIDVIVITADAEKKRLVLSHRAIEQEEKEKEKAARLAELKVGDVVDGKVESLKDYGAFIDLNGATGLLHVSQISRKRVKTPADVLKEGQEVKVKIIKIGDGKISLSMRALEEPDDHFTGRNNTLEETGGFKYEEKTRATTNLGDLLKNIKL
ncbi:S1 RNA-binding domain-containing protein [Stomatobaculum longum]|uniref:S1 RNA-binding domain-containing protein n=1 Tax=Stomatobaculum longum TaxID=796942 RepID=UPI0028D4DB56|nr:S1 RNA-binding domain-containing protein [Stomatobaculum longum]